MKNLLQLVFVAAMAMPAMAQSEKLVTAEPAQKPNVAVEDGEKVVYDVADKMPQFPGGINALMKYLNDNIKYPEVSEKKGKQGRVLVQYVVTEDGSIENIKVVKSVDRLLDKEAVRVVKAMPKWIPGEIKGKKISVRYTMPITFRLN